MKYWSSLFKPVHWNCSLRLSDRKGYTTLRTSWTSNSIRWWGRMARVRLLWQWKSNPSPVKIWLTVAVSRHFRSWVYRMDHTESQADHELFLLLRQCRSPWVCHQLSCTSVSRMVDCSKADHIRRHEPFVVVVFVPPTFVLADHANSINLDLLPGHHRQLRFGIYSRRESYG